MRPETTSDWDRSPCMCSLWFAQESPSNQVSGNLPKLIFFLFHCSYLLQSGANDTHNRFHHILWLINHRAHIVPQLMMMIVIWSLRKYPSHRNSLYKNAKTAREKCVELKRDKRDHSCRTMWNSFCFFYRNWEKFNFIF